MSLWAWCVALGLTPHERIKRNSKLFKLICMPGYVAYVLVCVYAVNGARGFWPGFWQLLVILSVMNLIDRFLVDDWWVGHTRAWTIPGTEDMKPYITGQDKKRKWLFGTVGMVVIAAVLAGVMALLVRGGTARHKRIRTPCTAGRPGFFVGVRN